MGVEFDGEARHCSASDVAHDDSRRQDIERHGWPIVVARKGDVLPDDGRLAAQVAAQLIEQGCELDLSTVERLARRVSRTPRSR